MQQHLALIWLALQAPKRFLDFFLNPTDQQQKHHLSKINEGLHFAINML